MESYFFFFKQKTAYEIMPSLVGSEMCIRDRGNIHASFGDRMTRNPVIACDFESYNSPNQILFKMRRPLLPPQQRRATHPQMAQHMLIRVWVKPSAHLVELQ